jgi:hypothetical protein
MGYNLAVGGMFPVSVSVSGALTTTGPTMVTIRCTSDPTIVTSAELDAVQVANITTF